MPNLAPPPGAPAAFQRAPLVYASPPRPLTGDNTLSQVLSNISFAFSGTGAVAGSGFPVAVLVASQVFDFQVAIISVSLASSIVNATSDAVAAAFVAKNNAATMNAQGATDLYIEHIVNAGLGHSFRSGTVFDDTIAPIYAAGQSIGLFLSSSGTGVASNKIAGTVTIRYMALDS